MDFLSVLEIIVVVICAITYGFMLFFKVRGNVLGAVSELIALAEASGLTGSEKMSQVVNGLYVKIPAPLKKIFTPSAFRASPRRFSTGCGSMPTNTRRTAKQAWSRRPKR